MKPLPTPWAEKFEDPEAPISLGRDDKKMAEKRKSQ